MDLTQLSPSFNISNLIMIILGTIAWFFGEFRTRHGEEEFNLKKWWKENWYNIPLTLALSAAYFMINKNIDLEEAFLIGLNANVLVDWYVDLKDKKKGLR